jgi:hypothetical protein
MKHLLQGIGSEKDQKEWVSLPRAATLKIHDYKSDTDVKDFAGHLTLDTYKGSAALLGDRERRRPARHAVHGQGKLSIRRG